MDSQYGVSLTVNGRASYTVAIGPNIALDLQISPSRGAVLVNNYLVESQQRTQVSTLNAIRNGVNKLTLMNKAAKIAAVAPITANAINEVNSLNNVFSSMKRRKKRGTVELESQPKSKFRYFCVKISYLNIQDFSKNVIVTSERCIGVETMFKRRYVSTGITRPIYNSVSCLHPTLIHFFPFILGNG